MLCQKTSSGGDITRRGKKKEVPVRVPVAVPVPVPGTDINFIVVWVVVGVVASGSKTYQ